jgi:hypothetical protein
MFCSIHQLPRFLRLKATDWTAIITDFIPEAHTLFTVVQNGIWDACSCAACLAGLVHPA